MYILGINGMVEVIWYHLQGDGQELFLQLTGTSYPA